MEVGSSGILVILDVICGFRENIVSFEIKLWVLVSIGEVLIGVRIVFIFRGFNEWDVLNLGYIVWNCVFLMG